MRSPVSTFSALIFGEALLGGLSAGVQGAADGGPGVSLGACPVDGGGELGVGLVQLFVGDGQPLDDVEFAVGRQPTRRVSFTEGGAAGLAVGAQGCGAVAHDGGELAVRAVGGPFGIDAAGWTGVKVGLTWHSGGLGRCGLVGDDAFPGFVFGGVVGDVVLPAVPDDEQPRTGEDADGVGVVVSSVSGSLVEVGGPGVGVSGVAGEVADGVAELFVAGPAEPDRAQFAGLAGGGCRAGETGQRVWGGEAGAAVADSGTWLVRSLIGARRRSALSTVPTSRVTTRPRRSHAGHQTCQASRAMAWQHLGRIGNPSEVTDTRMVHQ